MKKIFYLFIVLLFMGTNTFSQEINKINNGVPIRKGKITLQDGKSEKFKNLKLSNGIVTYFDTNGKSIEQKSSVVFKITKTGNCALLGALSCGIGAAAGALQGKAQADSQGLDTKAIDSSLILGLTAGGVVIGGLIGMLIKTEKTVYKNNSSLSFYPAVNSTQDGRFYPMLALRLNFK